MSRLVNNRSIKISQRLCQAGMVVLSCCLSACSSKAYFPDLEAYVEEVQAKPKGQIKPLPEFKSHSTFAYSAAAMRNPFEPPVVVNASTLKFDAESVVEPDLSRPKEYLEQFSFDAMRMVGTIQRSEGGESTLWGIVNDSQGGIHRVKKGDYIGRSYGKIALISSNRIEVVEIVPNGEVGPDGKKLWIERPRNLILKTD